VAAKTKVNTMADIPERLDKVLIELTPPCSYIHTILS